MNSVKFIKLHFDSYARKDEIRGVYVWEMQDGKKVRFQTLADIGCRMLVVGRYDTRDEAVDAQEKLIMELDQ